MTQYVVRFTPEARADLLRLYDFLLEFDLQTAEASLEALSNGIRLLESMPFTCRKAAGGHLGPLWRELLVAFGSSGYVVLYEIENGNTVTIAAVRHQRERDYR